MILDSMPSAVRKKDAQADHSECREIARPGSKKVEEFATRFNEKVAEAAIARLAHQP
jgi:hypothetical protein